MDPKKYVVETSLINQLVDGSVHADEFPKDGTFVASHIQFDELSRTTNEKRRAELLKKFAEIIEVELPTDTIVLDASRLDKSNFGDEVSYELLKAELDSRNGCKPNNVQDALIAEMAMRKGYVLLTADYDLWQVACAHHIGTIYWTSGRYKGPAV
jgi:hypothetical protein